MTAQTRPLGAQISAMLRDRGVDTIFGIPGVHNIEMYRGIEEAGIRHILARRAAVPNGNALSKPFISRPVANPSRGNMPWPK